MVEDPRFARCQPEEFGRVESQDVAVLERADGVGIVVGTGDSEDLASELESDDLVARL